MSISRLNVAAWLVYHIYKIVYHMQNIGQFWTTSDFDREYLRTGTSAVISQIRRPACHISHNYTPTTADSDRNRKLKSYDGSDNKYSTSGGGSSDNEK